LTWRGSEEDLIIGATEVLKRDRPVFTVEVEATKEAATEALILR